MKSSTNLWLRNRAEKEYPSLSRRHCQLIVAATITVFQIISCQSIQAQDFWEKLTFPDSVESISISASEINGVSIGTNSGIYRSLDYGESWDFLGLVNKVIYSIAHNTNGNIYAGTSHSKYFPGLYLSEDNGLTWNTILPDVGVTGNILAINTWGDTIFASLWGGSGPTLVRSFNGGNDWDISYYNDNNSEHITKIIRSEDEEIYISHSAFNTDMGGVRKSVDFGETWELIGLFNYQVSSIALNDEGDLFGGCWGGLSDSTSSGLYVLRNISEQWEDLIVGPQINDIVINECGHIYFSGANPNTVMRSLDNGVTFEIINDGLPPGVMRDMVLDNNNYIFVTNRESVARSNDPLVSTHSQIETYLKEDWIVYPNPVRYSLNMRSNNNTSKMIHFSLYNSSGHRVLYNDQLRSRYDVYTDVSILPRGLYVLEIVDGNYISHIYKIIIIN